MTSAAEAVSAAPGNPPIPGLLGRLAAGRTLPIVVILFGLTVVWYLAAIWMNTERAERQFNRAKIENPSFSQLVTETWSLERPLLPTPGQIARDVWKSTALTAPTSKRSLLYHSWVTLSSSLIGFIAGTLLGIALAIGIVHVRTLDKSLMPWVIASQTIPILAIAPMIVVTLGNLGLTGLFPKAVISAYLSFFPVTIGMVKGFRSPDLIQLDLMRTYSADRQQVFSKLRWPSSMAFLFPSLKVAIALALVGAIVGELPTGAEAGIGARLLTGSYYGQMIQLWSALVMAGVLAMACIAGVAIAERFVLASRGGAR